MPGIPDEKLCVVTDDKGAAGKIDSAMKRTNSHNRGAKIILYSTPKLVQHMYREQGSISEDEMIRLISEGTSGNIVVMGTTTYDLEVNPEIAMSSADLVRKIMDVNIVF